MMGWMIFYLLFDLVDLNVGMNVFEWEIGLCLSCVVDWWWDGFLVKSFEV